ncbi:cysteine/serine-rich nuclear protein 2-like [Copidosoma floridanum]|uniref:cysteine/serine-rich nuclear protein 2-like n=1 Tax=Copidosoma floridanum TaxID=29053 RepID=UPI0006C9B12F|nr:cysteine/serine-rich nuclear protein 2-like [Copidosoma floridanum]
MASDLPENALKSSLKKKEMTQVGKNKSPQKVRFDLATVYHFPRNQGFISVPSRGGSTLGMSAVHSDEESFSFSDCEAVDEDEPRCKSIQPVPARERRCVLKSAGIDTIDPEEGRNCQKIRVSRRRCGCACKKGCDPERCPCSRSNVECQVNGKGFPCSCTSDGCANKSGRAEFDPVSVHIHYTTVRMEMMKLEGKQDEEKQRQESEEEEEEESPPPPRAKSPPARRPVTRSTSKQSNPAVATTLRRSPRLNKDLCTPESGLDYCWLTNSTNSMRAI